MWILLPGNGVGQRTWTELQHRTFAYNHKYYIIILCECGRRVLRVAGVRPRASGVRNRVAATKAAGKNALTADPPPRWKGRKNPKGVLYKTSSPSLSLLALVYLYIYITYTRRTTLTVAHTHKCTFYTRGDRNKNLKRRGPFYDPLTAAAATPFLHFFPPPLRRTTHPSAAGSVESPV